MSSREESDIGLLLERLQTHPDHGLSRVEAYNRLRRYGTNELERPYLGFVAVRTSAIACLAVGIVLAMDGLFVYALGAAGATICLLCLASALRTRYRELAMTSGGDFPVLCSGMRGGRLLQLLASELVPGDIVRLRAGEIVPADGRLTEAVNLLVQERSVTGDPEPMAKDALCSEECGNTVFMGTPVIRGRGTFVVTETGVRTRIGKARALARKRRRQSPAAACERTE